MSFYIGSQRVCPTIITSKGGTSDGIPREVDTNGVYGAPQSDFTFTLPSNATDLGGYALAYAFYTCPYITSADLSSLTKVSNPYSLYFIFRECVNLTSIDLSSLTVISGASGLYEIAYGATSLSSVDLSSLTTISGSNALYYAFRGCTSLTSINLGSLVTISGSMGLAYAFYDCSNLASVDLSSLASLTASNALQYAFHGCTSLVALSFPSLTSGSFGSNYTNQFRNMLNSVSGCTVHFPSNLQSVIGNWTDVTGGFGGTNTTVLFDLPATT